jgi:hypothetical protein
MVLGRTHRPPPFKPSPYSARYSVMPRSVSLQRTVSITSYQPPL